MADEQKTVSVEEFNQLAEKYKELEAKNAKLSKIFEERQTKTLDKEGILKILGIEKAPEKPIAEVIGEKVTTLEATIKQLQADKQKSDEILALNTKKDKVREAAKRFNFIDVNDVLGVIDYSNDDIEGQLKSIAESKKHWLKPQNMGGSFAGGNGGNAKDINEQIKKAYADGNISLAMQLKRQAGFKN